VRQMSDGLVENRFIKLHKFFLIWLQIQLIKEISNIIHLEFRRVFDLALLKKQKTSIESQNHRTVGVGRDLCGSPSPTLLPKQGHLQQAAQDLVQAGLEHLQRRRLHSLPGQPGPGLRHPQREEVLPHRITESQNGRGWKGPLWVI